VQTLTPPAGPPPVGPIKRLELWAKLLLAWVCSLVLWRRRVEALPAVPSRVLLVRLDDRVGEALLLTPLLTALKALRPAPEVHVLVHARTARVLDGHPEIDRLIPFNPRWRWLGPWAPGVARLRRERYPLVVSCANWTEPSVTAALIARLSAPHGVVVGPDLPVVRRLHSLNVLARSDTRSEVAQRVHLLSPLGCAPVDRLSFRAPVLTADVRALLAELAQRPFAVVNPGGRLGWRRVEPALFAAACRALLAEGLTPVVTWGPGESSLAAEVVRAVPGARVAPPTSLDALAALLSAARLTVCNNTGPMHLSVAVGAPTLGLFLRMDPQRWGHWGQSHRMLDLTPIEASARGAAVVAAVRELARRDAGGREALG
jgi:heptosyltransferase-3